MAAHFVDSVNGADGISDIEGKTARVAASEVGAEQVSILSKSLRPRSAFPNIRVIEVLRLFLLRVHSWLNPKNRKNFRLH